MRWRDRLWLLASQALNALCFGGDPDESISARAWRERSQDDGRRARRLDRVLGQGHCQAVHAAQLAREIARTHLPAAPEKP